MTVSAAASRGLTQWVLPDSQRRTSEDLLESLDVRRSAAKRSAFWLMLALSAVIATAGVIADSTATVIGAMIIAPLATPIMGVALGLIIRDRSLNLRSVKLVVFGSALVIAVGALGSLVLSMRYDLLGNAQIIGRTSPTLIDLTAAVATGFAGAIGMARRDVSDVLPGVAIAISLVPPLAVVGVCLGQGALALSLGAFVLFLSNVLAMILAGMAVFAVGYRSGRRGRGSNRRAYLTLAGLGALVLLILGGNSAVVVATSMYEHRVTVATKAWLAESPGAEFRGVSIVGNTMVVDIMAPTELPPVEELVDSLDGQVPAAFELILEVAQGQRVEAGTTR